jgi:hypothetical protein
MRKLLVLGLILAGCAIQAYAQDTALRVKQDTPRNRVWTLTRDAVQVHELSTQRLVRRIELPGWVYVGEPFGCPPDLVVTPSGAVVVASNVLPTIWHIDPHTFAPRQLELSLNADREKDVGFTALDFAADGTLRAASQSPRALWRIDVAAARGYKIRSEPARNGCEVHGG